jgi:hypothetical protein
MTFKIQKPKLLPDRRVGEAAEAKYWPWDSQALDDLWAFLRSM